jgi:two-component system response regulator HydG/two-component system response regulator AtoC
MIGESPAVRGTREYLTKVAASDCNVLITGETGTGKELVAQAIHSLSRRRAQPLVTINCAAIPDALLESEFFGYERGSFTGAHTAQEGRIQRANGGTVFLDEIGELNLFAQAKVLRFIESKELQRLGRHRSIPVDVRLVAATNHDLESQMAAGSFRRDLFYRLNVVRIHLPPLSERREDIPLLARHFVGELNRQQGCQVEGVDEEALALLMRHQWPGNIRELRNVLEAAFVVRREGRVSVPDLPGYFVLGGGNGRSESERERLLATLESVSWNKSQTARKLRWSRMTVYRKITKYRLAPRHTVGRRREPGRIPYLLEADAGIGRGERI